MAKLRNFFRSIRFQVVLFTIFIVIVGNSILGYTLTKEVTKKLLEEKREKLYGYGLNLSYIYNVLIKPSYEIKARDQYEAQKPKKIRTYEEILKIESEKTK